MTYEPKFRACPYEDSNCKCYHKKSGRSKCPFRNPKKCDFYTEWYNSSPDRRKSILVPMNPPKISIGVNTNGL